MAKHNYLVETITPDELKEKYPDNELAQLADSIIGYLKNEEITVHQIRVSGRIDDPSFGMFLELQDEEGEEFSPGPWLESDILIQLAPDFMDKKMMRVNNMPMQRIAKLAVAVTMGYPG